MVIDHPNSICDHDWQYPDVKTTLTTTITTFTTSFKIIFGILSHRLVQQTKSAKGMMLMQLGIPRWSVTISHQVNLQLRNHCFKVLYF